jgi:hypothetical protein
MEFTDPGFGQPWGHAFRRDGSLNRFGPRAGLLVGEERHRGRFAGPVATLAIPLQNGRDILVECRRRRQKNENGERHELYL